MGTSPPHASPRLLDRIARASASERQALLRQVPREVAAAFAVDLADEVPRRARTDLAEGQRLATAAVMLAKRSHDKAARARALRAEGHALALQATYRPALRRYTKAAGLFADIGDQVQLAVTFSGGLQTLIYLGMYDRAHAEARRARTILNRHGDRIRLARLESNVGNVYFRQDRFAKALACYERAAAEMRALDKPQDVAVALRNMAVCLTSLNQFEASRRTYAEARRYCQAHGLRMLVAEADYNIAYLYFLSGEYGPALRAYGEARTLSDEIGDRYHRALCDLDGAEVCLELNDLPSARRMAEDAASQFATLGMRYERAKALVFLATAQVRQGEATALALYGRARALFLADRNHPWTAAVDLARALAAFHMGRVADAARLAAGARQASLSPTARVSWDLLQARIALRTGRLAKARAASAAANERLRGVHAPALEWQVHQVRGEVREASGDIEGADVSYRRARRSLERLRTLLTSDALKVSYLADKLAVYESLVHLALSHGEVGGRQSAALCLIEEAKSRSLVDMLAFRAADLQTRRPAAIATAQEVRTLRHEVQAHQRRIASEAMRPDADDKRLRRMQARATSRARRLSAAVATLRASDADLASLQTGTVADLEAIRTALPVGTTVLEYYIARGTVLGCVLAADRVHVVRLGPEDEIFRVLRLLRFQLAKFQLGPDYVRTFSSALSAAAHHHLHELHTLLLAPLRPLINAARLVVVPHGPLHYLPFHALFDGRQYLMDDYAISYAPSATVYRLCQTKPGSPHKGSLVLALADGYAPHIRREAEEVSRVLPGVRVFTGEQATVGRLQQEGGSARYIHIAAHGYFRRDNPMLSAVKLSGGDLSLADLYNLALSADLVTLSGCGTGLSAIVGGDELVGLMRGLLHAGARSLLLTMWQVDDLSTAEFMSGFYHHLVGGSSKAEAVGLAMTTVRERFPHPYYWAPFTLVGHSTEDDPVVTGPLGP
jgi:tetratricopeptide (TPR) repeat protein